MGQDVVDQIDKNFKTFRLDKQTNRIINLRFQEETNIDEFFDIRAILNQNNVRYRFDKNFDFQLV